MGAEKVVSVAQVPLGQPPQFDAKRHTKYFLRCLKTYLPQPYTSNDSNRLSLAFFIVSALDLLDQLHGNTTAEERADYVNWVYSNQHPDGGFRAFPGSDLGQLANTDNAGWDPAHVPATYFALCLLLILDDGFERLKRRECLDWLARMQREDGSFGETLVHGTIQGGRDSRFGYCAAAVRYILAGPNHQAGHADIKVDKLVNCIRLAEAYDGGISDAPFHESHAGLTFCGLAALSLLGRLSPTRHIKYNSALSTGPTDPDSTIRWLVSRQTANICDDDALDTDFDTSEATFVGPSHHSTAAAEPNLQAKSTRSFDFQWTGMNGRCNKVADTCYAFWVGASLKILGEPSLTHEPSLRKWLLERTAHSALGGFGKIAGDLPDIYHSYLALAVLSMMDVREEGIIPLDPTMCISNRAKDRLLPLWKRWGCQ